MYVKAKRKGTPKGVPFLLFSLLKVSSIKTVVNSRAAALTGTNPSAATSEWTLLHSDFSLRKNRHIRRHSSSSQKGTLGSPARLQARSHRLAAATTFLRFRKTKKYSEETGSSANGSEQSEQRFLTGRWFTKR